MAKRILTIGMSVHQDFRGVWHTVQGIRESDPELLDQVEFLIVDNSPKDAYGERTRSWAKGYESSGCPVNYVSAAPRQSTSLRNLAFHAADTEYVMCVDSHVILKKGALAKLIQFLKGGHAQNDLFHGPLYHEVGSLVGTHMNPAFRGGNFGTWGTMKYEDGTNFDNPDAQPFEIPSQGMGLFVARRDSWLGFHIAFNHFAGEEGYIQEKYRAAGRQVWCLPFLGWIHCFGHVGGTTYVNTNYDKLRNHLIGFKEVGLPIEYPLEYYGHIVKEKATAECLANVESLGIVPMQRANPSEPPFLGFPFRINDQSRAEPQDYQSVERRLPVSDKRAS